MPLSNICVPVDSGFVALALSAYTLTKYVAPNSGGIQSIILVFQVGYTLPIGVVVVSATAFMLSTPLYAITISDTAVAIAGILEDWVQTMSPRNREGLATDSLLGLLFVPRSVFATPKTFLYNRSTFWVSDTAMLCRS